MNSEVILIGEAGTHHDGCEKTAMQLAELAAEAKIDIVKYQLCDTYQAMTKAASKGRGGKGGCIADDNPTAVPTLSQDAQRRVARRCDVLGMSYLTTAFDEQSLKFIAEDLESPILIISSAVLRFTPLVLGHARYKRKMILNTGMSTLGEIEDALGILAYGLLGCRGTPSTPAFREAYRSTEGLKLLKDSVTLMHCKTEYPVRSEEVNLQAMQIMKSAFGVDVGFSDHTVGSVAAKTAVAQGATVIEKRFILNDSMRTAAYETALASGELANFVNAVKSAQTGMSLNLNQCRADEFEDTRPAKQTLIAAANIVQGDIFTQENLSTRRPSIASSPFRYWELLGSISKRDYIKGELI